MAGFLCVKKNVAWGIGVMVGGAWSIANVWAMLAIVLAVSNKVAIQKLKWMIFLKYPVLYLAGFFIVLKSGLPKLGLIMGAVSAFIVGGILVACPKIA